MNQMPKETVLPHQAGPTTKAWSRFYLSEMTPPSAYCIWVHLKIMNLTQNKVFMAPNNNKISNNWQYLEKFSGFIVNSCESLKYIFVVYHLQSWMILVNCLKSLSHWISLYTMISFHLILPTFDNNFSIWGQNIWNKEARTLNKFWHLFYW